MLPLKNRPIIAHALDEILNSNFTKVYIILNKQHEELHDFLKENYPRVNIVMPPLTNGIASAILKLRDIIQGDYFGLMFPDILIKSKQPAMLQMQKAFEKHRSNILGLTRVLPEEKDFFGFCEFSKESLKRIDKNSFVIRKILTRNDREGDLYHIRSILSRSFFDFSNKLLNEGKDPNDSEVYEEMIPKEKFIALKLIGKAFDFGNPKSYKNALINF